MQTAIPPKDQKAVKNPIKATIVAKGYDKASGLDIQNFSPQLL